MLTEEDKRDLSHAIRKWRGIAEPIGPQHALWDQIFDAEAALRGDKTIIPELEILRIARSE